MKLMPPRTTQLALGISAALALVGCSQAQQPTPRKSTGQDPAKLAKEALEILKGKKNLRILELPGMDRPEFDAAIPFIRSTGGGYLIQDRDILTLEEGKISVATKRRPTEEEMAAMRFAWVIAKHVKSNAIIYAMESQLVAVGAGQMSRVDSTNIAISKSGGRTAGTVMASDAFFPFPDCIDIAAKVGITAIIQPGGSKKDQDSIDVANEHGIAMVFTGERHFKH